MNKLWSIKITSKKNLSIINRDFIAELVSEEARKTTKRFTFILHEIIESKKYCKLFIEGNKYAFINLLIVLKTNLSYAVISEIRTEVRGEVKFCST